MLTPEERYNQLVEKREEVLEAIKPICEVFNLNYDYLISTEGQTETLVLNETKIGCSCNSVEAVIDEILGYLFVTRWYHNRCLGAFETQSKNVIRRYWL